MKKIEFIKCFAVLLLITASVMSCKKDEANFVPTGFEITGSSSFEGTYKIDPNTTNVIKYVNQADDSKYMKTYSADEVSMWGVFRTTSYDTYLSYKIESDAIYPPESGWTCGVGVDKPNFKCTPIYE
ncbi:MAG: hypothetical protein GY756_10985 [bacterium]|nr:hypothetical protein [bacterium]